MFCFASFQLTETVAQLKEYVTERQRDASRVLTPVIQVAALLCAFRRAIQTELINAFLVHLHVSWRIRFHLLCRIMKWQGAQIVLPVFICNAGVCNWILWPTNPALNPQIVYKSNRTIYMRTLQFKGIITHLNSKLR